MPTGQKEGGGICLLLFLETKDVLLDCVLDNISLHTHNPLLPDSASIFFPDGSFVSLCTSPLYAYHNTHIHTNTHTIQIYCDGLMFHVWISTEN